MLRKALEDKRNSLSFQARQAVALEGIEDQLMRLNTVLSQFVAKTGR